MNRISTICAPPLPLLIFLPVFYGGGRGCANAARRFASLLIETKFRNRGRSKSDSKSLFFEGGEIGDRYFDSDYNIRIIFSGNGEVKRVYDYERVL